jgi:hypothetical protein
MKGLTLERIRTLKERSRMVLGCNLTMMEGNLAKHILTEQRQGQGQGQGQGREFAKAGQSLADQMLCFHLHSTFK